MNRLLLLFFICYFPIAILAQLPTPELIFQSGFEPGSHCIGQDNNSTDLSGIDASLPYANDWDTDLDDHPNIGHFRLQYHEGDSTDRFADVMVDPNNPENHVLHYRISEPDGDFGKIQADIYENEDFRNMHFSIRLFLPEDFNILKTAPFDFNAINLMDFWNNATWTGEGRRFKMSLNLVKTTEAVDSLHFRFRSKNFDGSDEIVWGGVNEDFVVPVGKWIKLDLYFQEGNRCKGRFVIRATVEGEAPEVIYNIKNCTTHPYEFSPDGLAHFSPMKLNVSEEIISYFNDNDKTLQLHWDDFVLWKDSVYMDTATDFANDLTLTTQSEVDAFVNDHPNVSSILGNLNVWSSDTDPILNLNALNNLDRIQGDLVIENNNSLTSIEGLKNVYSIGGTFELKYNPALMSLEMDSLSCIGLDFQYTGNENIIDFTGLQNLDRIGRHLEIRKSGLQNLNGLELIERLGGRLVIEDNDALLHTDALIELRDIVGQLSITDNEVLEDISGLENIKHNDIEWLFINFNPNLAICHLENICEYLEDADPAQIMNNAPGCESIGAVISNCGFADADNDGFLSAVDCDDNDPAINPGATEIWNNDIDEDCNGIAEEEDADQDGFNILEDCDDNNFYVNADATEILYNGLDDDCDPNTLDDDLDQDGYPLALDCDDEDPSINPSAQEIPNNGIDENCDNSDELDDLDNDGYDVNQDCNDGDPNVNPSATEIPYNGIDDDCNPNTLDDDFDMDGFPLAQDCDDNDPNVYPSNNEIPYNGIDDDCNPDTPDNDLDQDGFLYPADCDDNNENVNADQTEIPYNGLDDDCNPNTLDDDFDQDGYGQNLDCDDNDPSINPGIAEIPYNGIDDDCDPNTPDVDIDQDGYLAPEDCNDFNNSINPGMVEIPNNGIDENCDGLDGIVDLDNDGYMNDVDCDDANPNINPGAIEIPYNGIDDDCNSNTLDDDLDQDGFTIDSDCNDLDNNVYPGATEVIYNGIDDDCNPMTLDDDLDQDGFLLINDCDDDNPSIHPGSPEIPYNGIDDDCNSDTFDDDLDQDGFLAADDCDDLNENVNTAAAEIPYNGIDDDCNADTADDDLDQDGWPLNDDCDDSNPNIHPSQFEIVYNGINDDCNEQTPDDDLDGDGFSLLEDCHDNNPDINPSAQEIPDNDVDENCDGAMEKTEEEYLLPGVYPNPSNGEMTITGLKGITMQVRNIVGDDILQTIQIKSNREAVDLSHLQEGIFVLSFLTEEEFISLKVAIFED